MSHPRISRHCSKSVLAWLVCLSLIGGITQLGSLAVAQSPQDPRLRLDQAAEKLRTAIKETRSAVLEFIHSPAAESEEWAERWRIASDGGKSAANELKSAAVDILLEEANPDVEIQTIAWQVLHESVGKLQLKKAWPIASRLVELAPDDQQKKIVATRVALLTNRFADAKRLMQEINAVQAGFSKEEMVLVRNLDTLIDAWQHESDLRESENAADDLPRVELETTQGTIVIELFENQAPETVGNFIDLVESGFYSEVFFHRVVKSSLIEAVAQVGVFGTRGPKVPDYNIYDEFEVADARKHFRGSVSMANNESVPNSGNSQFFITFVPLPHVDGHHTVFGRVVSDMQVIDSLKATVSVDDKGESTPIESIVPDRIVTARVLRKRDHEYKPHRVESE